MAAASEEADFRVVALHQDGSLTLALVGDVDAAGHRALLVKLFRELDGYAAGQVTIDLSGLGFCDGGGLRIIEVCCRELRPPGRVRLTHAPKMCRRMIELLDITDTFDLEADRASSREGA